MFIKDFAKQILAHLLIASVIVSGTFIFVSPEPSVIAMAEEIVISDNGSGSSNEVNVTSGSSTTVEQSNSVDIENNISTTTNTGGNEINNTTNGESTIVTGDSSQNIEVVNEANHSTVKEECCTDKGSSINVSNNGSNSHNAVNSDKKNVTDVNVSQNANITNNINGNANTGYNKVSGNNGDVNIKTGNIKVYGAVVNKRINTSDIEVAKNSSSNNIVINGNGAYSVNHVTLTHIDLFNINTDFNADIYNNANWSLNTGKNIAKNNIGDVSIATGDIDFNFLIKNEKINFGNVLVPCCKVVVPGDGEPEKPREENPGNGGENGNGEEEDKPGGGLIIAAADVSKKVGEVLGLSPTSGVPTDNPLIFWAGLLFLTLGLTVIGKTFAEEELPA